MYNRGPPRNWPWSSGSKVWHTNHYATWSDSAPPKLTIYIGYTIRVPAIFVFAFMVWTLKFCLLFDFERSIYQYLVLSETIIYNNGSIDISDTFSDFIFFQKMRKYMYLSDISVSENCIDPDLKMVEKTGPRKLSTFPANQNTRNCS